MSQLKFKDHRSILLLLGMLIALGPLSIDMYLPAFSQIGGDFAASIAKVELSLASFFIGLSLGQLLYGPITDRFGRKAPLYFGLSLYALASIGCALSLNIEMLIGLRFFQALGACAGMVITRATIRDLFNHEDSAKAFSMLMLVMGLAPILAPVIGGQLIRFFHWQSIFWVGVAASLFCLVAIKKWLPETRKADPNVKISRAFITYFDILKDRDFTRNAIAGGLAQAGMFAYITGSSFVFINFFGVKPENFGWFFGMNAAGFILMAQLNSYLIGRYGANNVLNTALKGTAFFALALMLASNLWPVLPVISLCLFFYVASLGIVLPNSTAAALVHQAHRAGAASALIGTFQFIFATFTSSAISYFHAENVIPMGALIGFCGVGALGVFHLLKMRPAPSQAV